MRAFKVVLGTGAATAVALVLAMSGVGPAGAVVFANPQPIVIQPVQFGNGTSDPYPSTITVTGPTGCTVTDVNVTLNGLSHTFPDDIDVLVAGPGGQRALVMSDAGGDPNLVGVNLTFDDEAATVLPDNAQIVGGTYRPTNYLAITDAFPSPAPPAPRPVTLTTFDGSGPNGLWRLYVVDDNTFSDSGSVSGGWALDIARSCPAADLSIAKVCDTGPVAPGDIVNCSVTVTNAGPLVAESVSVSDTLPADVSLVGTPGGGGFSCGTGATFTCTLSTLGANQSATFSFAVTVSGPVLPGASFTNTATVSSATPDPGPGPNSASAVTTTVSCTITGSGDIFGTEGNDVICGSPGADRIAGLGGDDVIFAGDGDDQVTGGDGDDRIAGGVGSDQVLGGAGNDQLFGGGGGVDRLSGGSGDDILVNVDGAGGDFAAGGEHVAGDVCRVDPGDFVAACEL